MKWLNNKKWIQGIAWLNGVGLTMLAINTIPVLHGSKLTSSVLVNIWFQLLLTNVFTMEQWLRVYLMGKIESSYLTYLGSHALNSKFMIWETITLSI